MTCTVCIFSFLLMSNSASSMKRVGHFQSKTTDEVPFNHNTITSTSTVGSIFYRQRIISGMATFITSNLRRVFPSSPSSSWFTWTRAAIAALPLAVWAKDSFFSLCRVRGTSMEPTLFDGDIVVVRKSDGIWQRWTRNTLKKSSGSSSTSPSNDNTDRSEDNNNNNNPSHSNERWATERRRVLVHERLHCGTTGTTRLLHTPPIPIVGNIVVFKDPQTFPSNWSIKRVVGLGGQTVLRYSGRNERDTTSDKVTTTDDSDEYWTKMELVTRAVPPYSLWVEGDNSRVSVDSRYRDHGPISKKLLVGIAEYRVWPPWRIGKLDNSEDVTMSTISARTGRDDRHRSQTRSYWPGRP